MKTKRHPPNPDPENTNVELCYVYDDTGARVGMVSRETFEVDRRRLIREMNVAISFARIDVIDAELLLARTRRELKRIEQNLNRLEGEDGKLSSSSDAPTGTRGPGGCCR